MVEINDCPKCGTRLVERKTKLYVDERISKLEDMQTKLSRMAYGTKKFKEE